MSWTALKLWAEDEEPRIHKCLVEALRHLISSQCVSPSDSELVISGRLRKHLYKVKKEMRLAWQMLPETSVFLGEDTPKPTGHPDFCFSHNTPDYDQYEYHVECKLVRVRRKGKSHDYCKYYVTDGICRFQDGTYAHSVPPMGAMLGYVQEGDILSLLSVINAEVEKQKLNGIALGEMVKEGDVTCLSQHLKRKSDELVLTHLWADFR